MSTYVYLHAHNKYAIHTNIGGNWHLVSDDLLFDTRAEAEAALGEHITALQHAHDAGFMPEPPYPDDFQIIGVLV